MRRASCDLPAPVGPVRRIGSAERTATRSIVSTSALKRALRVSMPPLRNERSFCRSVSKPVVFRKVEVDDPHRAPAVAVPAGRGLDEFARQVVRFVEEEEANLADVRTGRDVDVGIFSLPAELVRPRPVVELAVDFFEVPRVGEIEALQEDPGLRRDAPDFPLDPLRQVERPDVVQKVELVEAERALHRERHVRAPRRAVRRAAAVEGRTKKRKDGRFHWGGVFYLSYKIESILKDITSGADSVEIPIFRLARRLLLGLRRGPPSGFNLRSRRRPRPPLAALRPGTGTMPRASCGKAADASPRERANAGRNQFLVFLFDPP